MTYINFKLDTDADGIVLITWDAPGRSMNVIDLNVIDELHVFGLRKPKVLTLEQKPKRIGRWHHAGDALGSAGAGKQANLDFRQSHARVRALACDPVMTR